MRYVCFELCWVCIMAWNGVRKFVGTSFVNGAQDGRQKGEMTRVYGEWRVFGAVERKV